MLMKIRWWNDGEINGKNEEHYIARQDRLNGKIVGNQMCLDKLGEYENLEEQGLLLRLPCKVGTTVYNTTWWDDVQEKVKVDGKTFYRTVHKYEVSKSTFSLVDIYEFGKTVFLTKAEAEQKLKEMESNNNGTMEQKHSTEM